MLISAGAASGAPVSALVWLLIPIIALAGGIAYVIWVSRYQARYEKRTNRSVGKFQKFQESMRQDQSKRDQLGKKDQLGR